MFTRGEICRLLIMMAAQICHSRTGILRHIGGSVRIRDGRPEARRGLFQWAEKLTSIGSGTTRVWASHKSLQNIWLPYRHLFWSYKCKNERIGNEDSANHGI